jgi:hypothetical protein
MRWMTFASPGICTVQCGSPFRLFGYVLFFCAAGVNHATPSSVACASTTMNVLPAQGVCLAVNIHAADKPPHRPSTREPGAVRTQQTTGAARTRDNYKPASAPTRGTSLTSYTSTTTTPTVAGRHLAQRRPSRRWGHVPPTAATHLPRQQRQTSPVVV